MGRAAVPSGASTGSRGPSGCVVMAMRPRYLGKVCCGGERQLPEISEALIGLDAEEQAFLDKTLIGLDGTDSKSRLGANAAGRLDGRGQAASEEAGLPPLPYFGFGGMAMPVPMMNVINAVVPTPATPWTSRMHDHAGRREASVKPCAAAPRSSIT